MLPLGPSLMLQEVRAVDVVAALLESGGHGSHDLVEEEVGQGGVQSRFELEINLMEPTQTRHKCRMDYRKVDTREKLWFN